MSARLRVVVADDERPARSFLVALLRSFEDVAVVGEAASGKGAVAMIEKERPDLAFLDWEMPELDGMGVVRQLRKQSMPLIAFVTAYDEYAVRAFEVNAVDYLLKPVDKSRLRETLNRAQDRMDHAEIAVDQTSAGPPFLERIPVRHGEEVVIVPMQQIASIVADGELMNITTTRNERHTITYRLKTSSGCSIRRGSSASAAARSPMSIRSAGSLCRAGRTWPSSPTGRSCPSAASNRASCASAFSSCRQPSACGCDPSAAPDRRLVENRAPGVPPFRSVDADMARADGPHTRNPIPGRLYRGSRKRISSLAPFEDLPITFWLLIAIALLMAGMCAALILGQLERLR